MLKKLLFLFSVFLFVKSDEKCSGDSIESFENELISYVDNLENKSSFGDFLVLKKVKDIPRGKNGKENIIERSVRYLEEHEIKLKIPGSEVGRSISEARSKRIRRLLLPILFILKLKMAIIFSILLSIVGFVAFNGLGAGLTAMAIASVSALRSLFERKRTTQISYDIIPQVNPLSHLDHSRFVEVDPAYLTLV